MSDFFVSYNKDDKAWAEWIAWELEEAGYTVIIQAWDFPAGCNFVVEMDRATKDCQRTIAVLSPSYLDALFTHPEWAAAFRRDPKGEGRKLIGVRVKECDVEGLLGSIVYVDAVGLDEDQARQKLLDGVSGKRGKPEEKPLFPPQAQAAPEARPKPDFPRADAKSAMKVFNVPYPPSSNFTGRGELLGQLATALEGQGSAALVQPQAIHGLGGVGKTQLALKYAHDHRADYVAVWWLPAEEPATLASQFAGLALALGLVKRLDQDPRINIDMVRHWLESNTGWLLIFDNAPDAKAVRDYVPREGQGHVIITSRSPLWTGLAQALDVNKWPEPEAVAFLLKRTKREDQAGALAVAKELGCFPLALEQAGAYMEETGEGFSGYLEVFRQQRCRLLGRPPSYSEYDYTVATTWEANFQWVADKHPAAAQLLDLCAFLAPEDIPLDMIQAGAGLLPSPLCSEAATRGGLNDCLLDLRRFSLIFRNDELLSLHRVVQMVAQDRLPEDQRRQWVFAAVGLVERVFPKVYEDQSTWEACARLLPQALAVIGRAEEEENAWGLAGRLLIQVGYYLMQMADYQQAGDLLAKAQTWLRQAHGPLYPHLAKAIHVYGGVRHYQGHYGEAETLYRQALAILEQVDTVGGEEIARVLNSLGIVRNDQGDLAGAKKLHERALAMREKAMGLNPSDVASSLANLAEVLRQQRDLAGAKELVQRALAIWEKALGPDHPDVAAILNNLALVLRDQGHPGEAKTLSLRALAIREKALGEDHPDVANSLEGLAAVYYDERDYRQAFKLMKQALAIQEKALGPDHPRLGLMLNNMANICQDMGNRPAANIYRQRAQAIATRRTVKAQAKRQAKGKAKAGKKRR